jgi:hypothetical protein
MVSKSPWNAEVVELERENAWKISDQHQKKRVWELRFHPIRKRKITASSSKKSWT